MKKELKMKKKWKPKKKIINNTMPKGVFKRKPFTKQHKLNLSLSHIGKGHPCSDETRNKMKIIAKEKRFGYWSKGRTFSDEWKLKMSERQRGEKSNNWKGGISPLNKIIRNHLDYSIWRKAIFERDNFTCQNCKIRCHKGLGKTVVLHPHHIKPFSIIMREYNIKKFEEAISCKELWDVNNGITFCKECHKNAHKSNKERCIEQEEKEEEKEMEAEEKDIKL